MTAQLYVQTLRGMPAHGSIGEAIAKMYLIHERHIQGFGAWQSILGTALSQTEPFIMAADSIGELISNMFMLRPGYIPETWDASINKILKEAQFETEKAIKKAEYAGDPSKQVFIAERQIDPEEAMRAVDMWAKLADQR